MFININILDTTREQIERNTISTLYTHSYKQRVSA